MARALDLKKIVWGEATRLKDEIFELTRIDVYAAYYQHVV